MVLILTTGSEIKSCSASNRRAAGLLIDSQLYAYNSAQYNKLSCVSNCHVDFLCSLDDSTWVWIGLPYRVGSMSLPCGLCRLHGGPRAAVLVWTATFIAVKDLVEYLPLLSRNSNVVLLYAHGRATRSAKDHAFANMV